jgi:hypothetical protein
MTNVQLAGRLLTAPRRFFADLLEAPRFALPMWLLVLSTCGIVLWFYSVANIEWLIDQQMQSDPRTAQMTEEQRAQAARFVTRGFITWASLIAALVIIFVLRLLEALWYKLAGRVTGHRRSFRQWFAFAWWTSTPGLIAIIPSVLVLAFSPANQLDAGALQPLSLNELFFHRKIGDPGYQVLSNVSALSALSLALTVYGVRCWSGRSWLYSVLFGLFIPLVFAAVVMAFVIRP